MRSYALSIGAILSVLAASLLPGVTFAQSQPTSLSTSPVSRVLQVSPGRTVTTTLDVEDNSATPLPIKVQLETFRPYGNKGQAQIVNTAPNSAYISWVHFSQTSFTAQPGVWTAIKMTVSPPSTAALDYYYAVLIKPQAPVSPLNHNGAVIKGYNAILILLNVESPNAHPKLSVVNFSASHTIYEYLPATFDISVDNPGNVFMAPTGDIYVSRSNNFAKTIATIPINYAQGNVIPGSNRVFQQNWTDGFPVFVPKTVDGQPVVSKSGKPIETLQWDFSRTNKFRFGEYYAKMVLVYNNGTRDVPVTAVVSFWVIPWKIIGGTVIVLILCMVGLYVSGHKLADRTVRISRKVKVRKH